MYATNEWDKLKKVIVGVADYATMPPVEIDTRTINYAGVKPKKKMFGFGDEEYLPIKVGPFPEQVIEEANEDLEVFVKFLEGEGVEVVRPKREPVNYYNYCPRDSVFVHGDFALATPMPLRSRRGEWKAMSEHLPNIIDMPCQYLNELYNEDCIGNPDVLALKEVTPAFDAANTIRANNDILYLISNSGNELGAKILQKKLKLSGSDARVHLLRDVYSFSHIDTTLVFLREGLILANPSRLKSKDQLPSPFNEWDLVYAPEAIDIGSYPGYNNMSVWVNMNMFSVSPNLVALEENQEPTRKILEKHGIECAMLPMRHQRTLSGGFHCVTLDLERE